MHLCETAADIADLIEEGRLDRVQETVTDLHRYGLCRRRLNRALAEVDAPAAMRRLARRLPADLNETEVLFLLNWADTCQRQAKEKVDGPVPAAVCMLREAARAHRRRDYERGRRLYQRAVERFGKDEVVYAIEAFRLSFTPLPRMAVERPRVKSGFAA
jgi:hypothetical protein